MSYTELNCFKVSVNAGVSNVLIDNPPINLMDKDFMVATGRLVKLLRDDDAVRVMVFRSADPDFFIAHADLNVILNSNSIDYDPAERLLLVNYGLQLLHSMPKISIAQIEGQAYGGGAEFLLAMDMRFAAIGKTNIGFPEAGLGIMPAAGGSTRMPDLIGRSRALEMALSDEGYDAELAERYGFVNRALPAGEITAYVDKLAARIAAHPPAAIAAIKKQMNQPPSISLEQRLIQEQVASYHLCREPAAEARMKQALDLGMQQRDQELAITALMDKLASS